MAFVPFIGMQIFSMAFSFFVIGVTFNVLCIRDAITSGDLDVFAILNNTTLELFQGDMLLLVSLLAETFYTIFTIIWFRFAKKKESGAFTITDFNMMSFIAVLLGAVGTYVCTDYLATFISILRPDWLESMAEIQESAGFLNEPSVILILYVCIMGPISEEIMFRGLTYHYLKKALPVWLAIIMQAVFFALAHMNILQGIYTFLMGLLLGVIAEKTGSIVWGMIVHIIVNIIGTYASYVELPDLAIFVWIGILAGVIVFTITAFYFFFKGVKLRHLEIEYLKGDAQVIDLNED